jgi:hypothetical protein
MVIEMTHPEDREHVGRAVAKAARDGVLAPLDYRIVRADGTMRQLRATLSVLDEAEGRSRPPADLSARRPPP